MPGKPKWDEQRLQRLFERYDRLYWRRKLKRYRITAASLTNGTQGLCNSSQRTITIDFARHKTDRDLRGTVLHEMAHAAADTRGSRGHDVVFFAELERLLRLGAPVIVGAAEAGNVRILADIVPSRFPLLKRKMERAEARRSKAVEKYAAEKNLQWEEITDDTIVGYFGESGHWTWKQTVRAIGLQFGLVNEVGRAVGSPWARKVLARARRAHALARRDHLEYERNERKYFSSDESAVPG
jgi:hypothetical protein